MDDSWLTRPLRRNTPKLIADEVFALFIRHPHHLAALPLIHQAEKVPFWPFTGTEAAPAVQPADASTCVLTTKPRSSCASSQPGAQEDLRCSTRTTPTARRGLDGVTVRCG